MFCMTWASITSSMSCISAAMLPPYRWRSALDIKADICFLSEISATKAVQKTLGTKLLNHGEIHWGEACPPRTETRVPDECLRGDSLGVAIYSRMPVRLSRNPVEPWLLQSCRYMERWIKIARLDVLVICIYGGKI